MPHHTCVLRDINQDQDSMNRYLPSREVNIRFISPNPKPAKSQKVTYFYTQMICLYQKLNANSCKKWVIDIFLGLDVFLTIKPSKYFKKIFPSKQKIIGM